MRFAISHLITFDRQNYRIIWRSLIFKVPTLTVVLNGRDWHGMYDFPCMKNQPYNSVSIKYWPFIYWYKAIGTTNPFKQQHKRALELKFMSNFTNCKQIVCLPACLTATINLQPKLLGLWPPFIPGTKLISVHLLFSWRLVSSSVSRLFLVYSAWSLLLRNPVTHT